MPEIYIDTAGSQNWTVPADWDIKAPNKIELVGGGGGGGISLIYELYTFFDFNSIPQTNRLGYRFYNYGLGGGGGAYARITNVNLVPGQVIPVSVGGGGEQGVRTAIYSTTGFNKINYGGGGGSTFFGSAESIIFVSSRAGSWNMDYISGFESPQGVNHQGGIFGDPSNTNNVKVPPGFLTTRVDYGQGMSRNYDLSFQIPPSFKTDPFNLPINGRWPTGENPATFPGFPGVAPDNPTFIVNPNNQSFIYGAGGAGEIMQRPGGFASPPTPSFVVVPPQPGNKGVIKITYVSTGTHQNCVWIS